MSSPDKGMFKVLLELFKLLWGRETKVRGHLVLGVAQELAGVGLGVIGPFALKTLIDGLGSGSARAPFLVGCVSLFIVSWAGASLISTWRMVLSGQVVDRLTRTLATSVIRAQLPIAAGARTGDSGRTSGHIERLPFSLTVVLDGLIWHVGPLALQIAVSLWLLAVTIPASYSLILMGVLVGYCAAAWWGARAHQALAVQANLAASQVSQNTGDVLRNARRVVFNGALAQEIAHLGDAFAETATSKTRMMWSLLRVSSVQFTLLGAGLFGLLAMGVTDTLTRRMSVGDFVLLQAYAFRLAAPLGGVGFILSQASAALVNIRDVFRLIPPASEQREQPGAVTRPTMLSVRNLNFSYDADGVGLKDIDFDLAPGSFNVIVGPNGSGKSTLAQLLAGILTPATGSVSVGGQDLGQVTPQERHRYALYVPQFIGLFNRSLGANALYPPSTNTAARLIKLLTKWKFHEDRRAIDISGMVGEQGERLSGGQVQKLELARIMGMKMPVIILDESTSALDHRSEETIMRDLLDRFRGKTTLIVITHRLSLAEGADHVLVLKGGELVGFGRHIDLIHNCPDYVELRRQ
jgi:ATP-binding cassette subfamily B protein